MTEQNQEPTPAAGQEPEHASGHAAPVAAGRAEAQPLAADAAWPALPSGLDSADPSGKQVPGQDAAVSAVLDRLAAVRHTPVAGHSDLYAGMHDALLKALNEDVTGYASMARRVHAAGDAGS